MYTSVLATSVTCMCQHVAVQAILRPLTNELPFQLIYDLFLRFGEKAQETEQVGQSEDVA